MLLSEIIYNIKNLVAGGIESDDQDWSNSQVSFIIDYYRATLLKRDQERNRFNKDLYVQNLGKIELKEDDKNELCEPETCILKSTIQLPTPMIVGDGISLTFVGTMEGRPFHKRNHNAMYYKRAAKYVGRQPAYYFQNGYIYLVDPPTKMFSHLNVQGVFERPSMARKLVACGDGDCFETFDFEYPLPLHHVETIVKLVAQTELKVLTSIPVDTANNSINQLADMLKGPTK